MTMSCYGKSLNLLQKAYPLLSQKYSLKTLYTININKETSVQSYRHVLKTATCSLHLSIPKKKVFEPDYLDAAGLVPPTYPAINIQMKGYNFEVLESFQSFVHNMAENIGIDVSEAWATPASTFDAYTYAEESTVVKDTYTLDLYERNIQIVNTQTTDLPVLIDIIRKTLPEGVQLSIHEHDTSHSEARYIPDPLIDGLRAQVTQYETKKQLAIAEALAEKAAKGKTK